MPKIEVISSDEDDDIWDYQSQTQKARKSQNDSRSKSSTVSENQRKDRQSKRFERSRSSLSQKQVKTEDGDSIIINKPQKQKKAAGKKKIKVKVEVKKECTPNAKQDIDRSGRCPVCQMPFKLLSAIETPSWHVDQCLDVPYSSKNECPAALECNSEFSSHYKKFRHTYIARSRRKNEITNKDKGNVESAKTKLSFNDQTDDKKLVVPGSSSDCVIILDSSQDSNFSHRSNDDIIDYEDLPSPVDKKNKEFRDMNSREKPLKKKFKGKDFDKNSNFLNKDACRDLDKELFGTNSECDENMIGEDFENDNAELEGMNSYVVSVSDYSHGSVQDIDALVDDTRSVSDMIRDALVPDDDAESEESEVFTFRDDINVKEIRKYNDTRTGEDESSENKSEEKDGLLDGKKTYKYNDDEDDDDDLISLFTDRTSKKTIDRSTKQSAISFLGKTPEKSNDSNSSSDWEILKTTLTQPLFSEDIRDKTETKTKVDLDDNSALAYAVSHVTPSKESGNALAKHNVLNTEAKGINYFEGLKEKNEPKRGFFATKMLQMAKHNKSGNKFDYKTPEKKDKVDNFDNDQPEFDQIEEETVEETAPEEIACSETIGSKYRFKSSNLKRKSTNPLKNDAYKFPHMSPVLRERIPRDSVISEKVVNQNENRPDTPADKPKSDDLVKLTTVKVEKNRAETNHNEKKPKILLKPKTPQKRKKGRKDQKQVVSASKTRKESKNIGNVKLEAFFKPQKDGKSIPVVVQTDSESSGDCERFNKINRLVKCCEKCTEENSCRPNNLDKVLNISNSGDNNSRLKGTQNVKLRRASTLSSTCSQGICDNDSDFFSEATSSREVRNTQSSVKLTVSGNCQNCSQLGKNKSHSQSNRYTKESGEHPRQSHSSTQQSQDSRCLQQEHFQGCSLQTQNSQGQSCSHKNQDHSLSSKDFGSLPGHSLSSKDLGSLQNHSSSCQSHGQSCSHKNHSQNSSNQSQGSYGSQHCLHIKSCKSQNDSLNRTCSQNTLQFNIENVCTLSQNTYSNLGGGFIVDNDEENSGDPVDVPHCSDQTSSEVRSSTSNNAGRSASTSSSLSETDVESIIQIRKSATEILMASSRLLYNKSVKKNSGANGSQTSVEMSRKPGSGWTRNRRSTTTSSETSDNTNDGKRTCPFYKKIPDTCMTVDAFRYGNIPDCKAYILSHFHYDHYMGLNKRFQNPIYCTKITGNLVKKKIGVDSQYIHNIALNTPTVVENVELTFLEANHCPGAVLILFKLKSGKVFLHTGDFRASPAMELYPPLQNIKIHSLYLDTTYCDPQYDFPPQEEVIKYTVQLVLDTLASNPKTLIVCGTYTIGKERIFTAIAEELDCKICVMRDKKNVLDCMEDEGLKRRISLNWEDSGLHVVPMNKINYNGLQEHVLLNGKKYNSVLGIEPTGWTHNKKVISLQHIKPKVNKDNIKIYGVPYSEHSSFLELKRFVQFTRPVKILPTVNNGNVHSRRKMEVIFESWMNDDRITKTPVARQSSISGWAK